MGYYKNDLEEKSSTCELETGGRVGISKEENTKAFNQFRIILLLSIEGKNFFSVLAKRLNSFLRKNEYMDTSVQKGWVAETYGCRNKKRQANMKDLLTFCLDLTNAYGSLPHRVVL